MGTSSTIPLRDPVALIGQLDSNAIRERIDDLDRQRRALLILLRAAQTAEKRPKAVSRD